MVSVVVALVVGLTGALAALLPSILRSARRRMLHLMREEQELLKLVEDEPAAEDLRQALRVTASRYRMWVAVPPHKRSRAVLLQLLPFYLIVVVSLAATSVFASLVSDSEESSQRIQVAVMVITAISGLVFFSLALVPLVQSTNELESVREGHRRERSDLERRLRTVIRELEEEREALVAAEAPGDELANVDGRLEEVRELLAEFIAIPAEKELVQRKWWHLRRRSSTHE